MAIKVGDRVPSGTFMVMTAEGPKPKTSDELFKGKKVVLFAVPGAFTPTCHKNHLPGFVKNAGAIKGKGVDTIAVTGVNDVFVMDAWKKASGGDAIEFLADGSANWAKALGLTADLTERGLACVRNATPWSSRTAWSRRSMLKTRRAKPKCRALII